MPITYQTYYEDDELVTKIKKLQSEKQAMAEPPTGEFTKKFRAVSKLNQEWNDAKVEVRSIVNIKLIEEACDRLDAQQQKIERLTVVCNNLKSANRTFAAENAKFKEELAGPEHFVYITGGETCTRPDAEQQEIGRLVAENIRLVAENAKLKEELVPPYPYHKFL